MDCISVGLPGQVERRASRSAARAEDLLRLAYRPHHRLVDLLGDVLQALAQRTPLLQASISLHQVGTLVLGRSGDEITLDWLGEDTPVEPGAVWPVDAAVQAAEWQAPERTFAPPAAASGARAGSQALALQYAGLTIGEMCWTLVDEAGSDPDTLDLLRGLGPRLAYLAKRYAVQHWAEQHLGRGLLLVGTSHALHRLEVFIERAAARPLPTLLVGEFGTEKTLVAAAIHCCGAMAEGPFVEVNCADPAGRPEQWFAQARGGSLFFNGIDELSPALQGQLPLHMHSRLGQWLAVPMAQELRIIASTTRDLHQRARDGQFSRALLAELDFLSVTLPPLRERQQDIEPLVTAALQRHGEAAARQASEDLLALCRAYSWPDNLFELERVVARLAVMSEGQPIAYADVLRHASWMASDRRVAAPVEGAGPSERRLADADPGAQGRPADSGTERGGAADDLRPGLLPAAAARWAQCAISGDPSELTSLHDALRKALVYLGRHYDQAISLEQLAGQAHVSPSHLSFLFRSVLQTSFKSLLQWIRIQQARQMLLADQRQRITDVAMTVGFADLSHFEKSFRRIVGQSPRDYRRNGQA